RNGELPDLLAELFRRDLEALRASNRLEDEIRLDRADGVCARVAAEPKLVPALRLERGLERDAGALSPVLRRLDAVLGLVVDERLRKLDVDAIDQLLQDEVAHLRIGLPLLRLLQLLVEVGAELLHRV